MGCIGGFSRRECRYEVERRRAEYSTFSNLVATYTSAEAPQLSDDQIAGHFVRSTTLNNEGDPTGEVYRLYRTPDATGTADAWLDNGDDFSNEEVAPWMEITVTPENVQVKAFLEVRNGETTPVSILQFSTPDGPRAVLEGPSFIIAATHFSRDEVFTDPSNWNAITTGTTPVREGNTLENRAGASSGHYGKLYANGEIHLNYPRPVAS